MLNLKDFNIFWNKDCFVQQMETRVLEKCNTNAKHNKEKNSLTQMYKL